MRRFSRLRFVVLVVALAALILPQRSVHSQGASVSFTGQRSFVTGFIPIIGPNGGVGGIDVGADGVLKRVERQSNPQLGEARRQAIQGISADVHRTSPMRKVSLSRLEAEIARHAAAKEALGTDILYLAGLQRIEYVFVYPESNDIVIAGPAAGWTMRGDDVVSVASGDAVLRLDDLLDTFHSTVAVATGDRITCSIDPTVEGMVRLQRMLKSRNLDPTDAALKEMEQQLGDQNITVTGIRPTSHFARVMVSADYMMKRIAMNLEPSPVARLKSYLQLLQRRSRTTQLSAPRWWLTPKYDSVQKSEDSLAWHFHGRGVTANSEHGYLNQRGELINAGRPSPLAKLWADNFTSEYDSLAKELPVFGQLSGCVDLAVLAALIRREDLRQRADCPLSLLTDPSKLIGESFAVPKTVPSHARVLKRRKGWVVSVSGGVDLDTGSVLDDVETNPNLDPIRKAALDRDQQWWWD